MTAKQMAVHMMRCKALRDVVERLTGKPYAELTFEQRGAMAVVLAAADDAGGLKVIMGDKYPF